MAIDVLLADDDVSIHRLVTDVLKSEQLSVHAVSNGFEALRALKAFSPRVLLTDVFMPELDGIELIRMARRQRLDLKIIAISGGGSAMMRVDLLAAALHLGADATLQKPFRTRELLTLVRSFVRRHVALV